MDDVEFEDKGDGNFLVKGCLTFATVGTALEAGQKLFGKHTRIELDLSEVEGTDSAGLALLVEWIGWARREKHDLKFRHIPKQVLALAHISEVDTLLPMA